MWWNARLVLGAALLLLAGSAAATDPREAELFKALDRFDSGEHLGRFDALYQVTTALPRLSRRRTSSRHPCSARTTSARRCSISFRGPDRASTKAPRSEARARLSYWFDRPAPGHLPDVLIQAPPDRTKVVVADVARARLYLFDWSGGEWTLEGDWYASIGQGGVDKRRKGDGKTPLGVYFVTMRLAERHLPELYGAGALGLNYPNEWDRRRRRTGYGIWIHGEPRGLMSRARRWSRGCLTVSNPALETLVRTIEETSVPVIIGEWLRWLSPADHERHRDEWLTRIASLNGGGAARRDLGIYGYPVGAGDESAMMLVELREEEGAGWTLVAVLARARRPRVAHRP